MKSTPIRVPNHLLAEADAMAREKYRMANDRGEVVRDALRAYIEGWHANRNVTKAEA